MSPPDESFRAGGGLLPSPGAWREGGRVFDFVGAPVFGLSRGPTASPAAAVLFLHGVPGSSYDFARLWPRLGRKRALAAFDFVGFGLSGAAEGFGYGLVEQADVALAAAAALGVSRAHLVAHDVGGAVAAELLARRERKLSPLTIESLALLGGGPLPALCQGARLSRWVRRLAARGGAPRALSFALFRWAFRRGFGDPAVLGPAETRRAFDLFVDGESSPRAARALVYADELRQPPARWWAALARLDLPSLVLWGAHDRVLTANHAPQLGRHIRGARVRVLGGLGHSPQIEAPDAVAAELEAFWDDVEGP
ncbi:MAG TPA: alpha/beta hydrolase [Polyangiaceae bacterium]|nr:alpha/beta hydrolase [Polyangiaceae bacterium]